VIAVRAGKNKRFCNLFTACENTAADLAQVRTSAAGIVVNILMRGVAARTGDGFGNGVIAAAGDSFKGFVILPKVVFKQKLIILFLKLLDYRQLVSLELLISGRVQVVKGKLSERDIFRNELHKRKNCPFKVLNIPK